ncbi:hypothetical protein BY996DRAFT_7479233 [Phakopsora pachyrhizi]|nr:hypothetical protein BY996DRAFT_7479233 [Phakopsora pachyrhizi]
MVFNAMNSIRWKEVFVDDKMNELFERRALFLTNTKFPRRYTIYSINIKLRYRIRRLFLVYSTLINKIFCEGKKDLERNFHKRQEDAIHSFDKAWELVEIDRMSSRKNYHYGVSFIATKKLPLDARYVLNFLNTYDIKLGPEKTTSIFKFRANSRLRPQSEAVWKFIALWLAKYRVNLYNEIFSGNDKVVTKLKPFLNSLICCANFKNY